LDYSTAQDLVGTMPRNLALQRGYGEQSMTPNRRLKQERELRGWSQAKVAEQIGTDATTVSRWERGLFSPTPYFRERLCILFNKNAEELGLLDSTGISLEKEPSELLERRPRALTPLPPFQQEAERQQFASPHTATVVSPVAPSWACRDDTFEFILDSAAHDQQAHILWEDAYVRALRGQHSEAQQLGEASLNAFEHVGHPNAEALREWLKKNNLTSSSTPPDNIPSAPLPLLPKQPKRTIKHLLFQRRNFGLLSLFLAIAALAMASFALNQSIVPSVQAGVQNSPVAHIQVPAQISMQPTATATTAVASDPTAAPTAHPAVATPNPAVNANAPVLSVKITPGSLTPANCQVDSGYRCTLTIMMYSSGQGSLNWQMSSSSLPVHFNPSNGVEASGTTFQVIAYIQSSPGENCRLLFTLTSSSSTRTVAIPWQG
jgi:transcriptional regulator with XRE-family HTH domain